MEQSSSSSYLVLPDHEHCRVLVVHADGGWTLPSVTEHADGSWQIPHLGFPTPMKTDAISELKETLGLEITVLHSIDCDDPNSGSSSMPPDPSGSSIWHSRIAANWLPGGSSSPIGQCCRTPEPRGLSGSGSTGCQNACGGC